MHVTQTMGRMLLLITGLLLATACEDELPEAGSIPDLTLPEANFSYKSSTEDFKEILFTNLSISANAYAWDFGDGTTGTDKDPVHVYEGGEGTYTVTLTANDGNNETSTITIEVDVVDELVPEFACNSFECSDRSVWGSFSGSGSPTPPDGTTGAKLESDSHFLDQTIAVSPGVQYNVSFFYVSASSNGDGCGNLKISDGDDESTVFVEQSMPLTASSSEYVPASFIITTAAATQNLRFELTPGDVTGRYDFVTITKVD